jgi:hypothetical protein
LKFNGLEFCKRLFIIGFNGGKIMDIDINVKEKVNQSIDVADATSMYLKKAVELVDNDKSIESVKSVTKIQRTDGEVDKIYVGYTNKRKGNAFSYKIKTK